MSLFLYTTDDGWNPGSEGFCQQQGFTKHMLDSCIKYCRPYHPIEMLIYFVMKLLFEQHPRVLLYRSYIISLQYIYILITS